MTDRELFAQAVVALEYHTQQTRSISNTNLAIEALRARLAQPEQEPVAWITDGGKGELWWHQSVKFDDDGNLIGENPDDIPLYTAPPQREFIGLTEYEVGFLTVFDGLYDVEVPLLANFIRHIEAKLKEKNNG